MAIAAWTRLGGRLVSGPAAAAWGTRETEVWAILEDGALHDRYWDGTSWHDWDSLGSPEGVRLVGQPAAAARDAARIDVLAAGNDGGIWHRWWNGREWVAWRELSNAPRGATAVALQWVGERLEAYVRDADGALAYAVIPTGVP